jgi:hypothetical protein
MYPAGERRVQAFSFVVVMVVVAMVVVIVTAVVGLILTEW